MTRNRMDRRRSVILIEFNELSPSLMHRFLREGKLPNFHRFFHESEVFTSEAGEQAPYLEPWIQWVTVHSGIPYSRHGVFHLGDGHKLKQKCLWDVVSDAGKKSWVCGAMNVRADAGLNGWVLPDPWSVGVEPKPASLNSYYKFVRQHVQEYTNTRVPLTAGDYSRFLWFMLTHGLSARTAGAIVRQLLVERFDKTQWKRAVILDKLQFDLFRWYYRRERPELSVFFLNSTAHFQHMYWRELEPSRFQIKPSDAEQARYGNAILFGYQEMDRLLGRFCDLVDDDTTLIFGTALSQQPCLVYEGEGGKLLYRPRDFERFVRFVGVTGTFQASPVMSEQFHILFPNARKAREAYKLLKTVHVGNKPALGLECNGATVFAGCHLFEPVEPEAILSVSANGRTAPFYDIFYQVEGIKSGMHHPDGMLWIRRPDRRHRIHAGKVPLTDIAPTVLDILELSKPVHMRGRGLFGARQEAATMSPRMESVM